MNYPGRGAVTFGPRLTPLVKSLVIACVAAFVLQKLAGLEMIYIFGLRPVAVLTQFFLWQLVTYLFLHGGFWHILFNMFALWMFGSELERYLGTLKSFCLEMNYSWPPSFVEESTQGAVA